MEYKNLVRLICFIIFFVVLPIIGAYFLFWHNVELTVNSKKDNGALNIEIDKKSFLEPSIKNTVRKIFQSPFELFYYKLCIKNLNNVTINGEKKWLSTTTTIKIQNEKDNLVWINSNGSHCQIFNSETMRITSSTFDFTISQFPFLLEVDANIAPDETAKPVVHEQVASSLIFIFSVIGIEVLFLEIYELFKKLLQNCKNSFHKNSDDELIYEELRGEKDDVDI